MVPLPHTICKEDQALEREELGTVLASQLFSRAPGLCRILTFICEQYFEGQVPVREYDIGVQALGRRPDFTPIEDASVRVNVHNLRKKLALYYRTEGARHEIHIELPSGTYSPHFRKMRSTAAPHREFVEDISAAPVVQVPPATPPLPVAVPEIAPLPAPPKRRLAAIWTLGPAGIAALAILMVFLHLWTGRHPAPAPPIALEQMIDAPGPAIRIAAGASQPLVDSRGRTWSEDKWFSGGTIFSRPNHVIARTKNQLLFQRGREGNFSYEIPLKPGPHELHLYFAETLMREESLRSFYIGINGVYRPVLDVVSDAGSPDTVTAKVFCDVQPEHDGRLHLTFRPYLGKPFINAIEILPGLPARMRTVRLTARDSLYIDVNGHIWQPDHWFQGGRVATRTQPIANTPDAGLYNAERYGRFTYAIPVVDKHRYRLTLYFSELWFLNHDAPGVGHRIFSVYCNGLALLQNLDLVRADGDRNQPVIRVFDNIAPNPQGKIYLEFVPRVNYAEINAIQIEDETPLTPPQSSRPQPRQGGAKNL